ncbi:MAG: patatin-like phospholipase family protein [Solirubrobacteraceae bacterium]
MRLSSIRPFTSDPLSPTTAVTEDQRDHPVVALLRQRRAQRSAPRERTDGRTVALVIEGGGMRGVVSAGMTAAIEQLGFTNAFDEIHGASAGAFNAAFMIASQATYLTALYAHGFGNPRFVNAARVLRGGAPFDMDYVVHEVWRSQRPLRTERIIASPIALHCTATDTATAQIVDLTDLRSDAEIRTALLASARLPWLAGGPVSFKGMRLLDATLAEAVPVHVAHTTATDLLVLQTRPHGVAHQPLPGWLGNLTDRYLMGINPQLVELRRTRSARYDVLVAQLAREASDRHAHPAVCVIRPPAGSPPVGQMEVRASRMAMAGGYGFRTAWMALEGSDPELINAPTAV